MSGKEDLKAEVINQLTDDILQLKDALRDITKVRSLAMAKEIAVDALEEDIIIEEDDMYFGDTDDCYFGINDEDII